MENDDRVYVGPQIGDEWLLRHPSSAPWIVGGAFAGAILVASLVGGIGLLGALLAAVLVGLIMVAVMAIGGPWRRRAQATGWTMPRPTRRQRAIGLVIFVALVVLNVIQHRYVMAVVWLVVLGPNVRIFWRTRTKNG